MIGRATSSRLRLRAVTAAATLLALLVVPPLLLTAFGVQPLPGHWPTSHDLTHALRAPLSDTAVLRIVTAVAWLAWLHLCACVIAEAGAQLRGWQLRVPFGGVNRRVAHHLIAVTVLAAHGGAATGGVLTRAAPVAYPHAPATAMVSASFITQPPDPAVATVATDQALAVAGATSALAVQPTKPHLVYREYVVEPPQGRYHDNLWDIADRHLGDPLRWREIFALNEGRLMPDGQRLTRANLIRPGWVLRMPADATGVHLANTVTAAPKRPEPERPGIATATPPDMQPVPAPAAPVPAPRATATDAPTAGDGAAPTRNTTARDNHELPAAPIGAALALSAAGALVALTRRRRVAARRRPLGTRPAPPPAPLVDVEAKLRSSARSAAESIEMVRAVARFAAARNPDVAARAVLHQCDGTIDVIVTPTAAAPAPFTATDRGWQLAPSDHGFLLSVDTDAADPAPLLVPVGTVGDATCYVNLEVARTVGVIGDAALVDRFIAGVTQSVAGAPWGELAQVVVPAHLADAGVGRERVDVWRPGSPLLEHLAVYAGRVASSLTAQSLDAARRSRTDGDVAVILLAGLTGRDLPPALRAQLLSAGSPLVAVLHGQDADAQPWHLDERLLRIPGLDIDITPHLLDVELTARTAELLTHAAAAEPIAADDDALQPMSDDCPPDATDKPVSVNVLGPVEINGNGPAKRAGVRDLAVYLALHRRAIPVDVLATTVWPDREFNPDLMRTRMSETRRLLDCGIVHEGRSWRMTDTVGCDWQRFQALAAGDEDDRRRALQLVRGRPFEGYDNEWVQLEGFDRHIEAAIVDLALDVGQRAMDRGDPTTATWAANVGISACPYDERLYRLGMRAAAARGASGEARNLLNALRGVLDEQVEPDARIEPETLAEFDRAIRSQRAG